MKEFNAYPQMRRGTVAEAKFLGEQVTNSGANEASSMTKRMFHWPSQRRFDVGWRGKTASKCLGELMIKRITWNEGSRHAVSASVGLRV